MHKKYKIKIGQYETITREVATVDVATDEEVLVDLGRNADFHTTILLCIGTIQIANKSMTLGSRSDNYILNRAQTRIIFSRLVLTKSRRRSYDLRNG